MHKNSLNLMTMMLNKYASNITKGICYDIGSYDVNGSYRPIVENAGFKYVGLDIAKGPNVDFVIGNDSDNWPMEFQTTNLVISGQCLEHTKRPWEWIIAVTRLLRKKEPSYLLLIAPASWPEHKHPIDCWRFLPQGMESLAEWADLQYVEGGLSTGTSADSRGDDCWAVMRSKLA